MSSSALAPGPEVRIAELLSELEALLPGISPPNLLDLRDGLVRLEGAVLRLLLAAVVTVVTPPAKEPDFVMTLEEAAAYLKRSKSWVYHGWRNQCLGFRDGGRVRFRKRDLDRYVNAQRRGL